MRRFAVATWVWFTVGFGCASDPGQGQRSIEECSGAWSLIEVATEGNCVVRGTVDSDVIQVRAHSNGTLEAYMRSPIGLIPMIEGQVTISSFGRCSLDARFGKANPNPANNGLGAIVQATSYQGVMSGTVTAWASKPDGTIACSQAASVTGGSIAKVPTGAPPLANP